MKLHFESNLDHQQDAIKAVADLFAGQEINQAEFTVDWRIGNDEQRTMGTIESEYGIGNRLALSNEELVENMRDIQLRNGLPLSDSLNSRDFTVEMETGTGKTYVYLRTIFELYRRYGFTKFIIVVPSVAIREGAYKTLQITRDHFQGLYPEACGYEYFQYDSSRPGTIRSFASNSSVQIMIVTVGSINKKDANNLYKESEKMGDEKPIHLIRAVRPIIIVDEPQSVDGGINGKGREALGAMRPLCTLRYSATHANKHHMLYRLDAVDAYSKRLVKQIEVASLVAEGGYNKPYVKLIGVRNRRGVISANVEIDVMQGEKVSRAVRTIEDGDDLRRETGRDLYENFQVGTITCKKGHESIEVSTPSGEFTLGLGDEIGGINTDELKRQMIRRTIKTHLDKEKSLREQKRDVKVLSLFFIDSVKHYREYDEDGNKIKGKYARIFEEEYRKLAKNSDYQDLFNTIDSDIDVGKVHDGYFSIDKKGGWAETAENDQENRNNAERAYNLIMKDKEKLLSFETRLKFIFSHSALREGWDNPNVFQICALRDMGGERERRQTLGRGLRLCVDQSGQRLRDFDLNTLTVIASESYEQFAKGLQREIESDTDIQFGVVEKNEFARIPVSSKNKKTMPFGAASSEEVWKFLNDKGYLDNSGRVLESLRVALSKNTLVLPKKFNKQEEEITVILHKFAGGLEIKNADERVTISTNKTNLHSKGFRELWDRIKHKTTYSLKFNSQKLIENCINAITKDLHITKTKIRHHGASINVGRGGVEAVEISSSTSSLSVDDSNIDLPDLLTDIQERTRLKRKSIVNILIKCKRLNEFKKNPQEFIEVAAAIINKCKRNMISEGIRYQRIGDEHFYAQELFDAEELTGYLKNSLVAKKSVYERVVYDSVGVEKRFAEDMEKNEAVKVYTKLPPWFKIPTPLGTYNPDWAVFVKKDGGERAYFVVETKGSLSKEDHRKKEATKMMFGELHFAALKRGECPVRYMPATNVDEMLDKAE